jgi:prepilin-type N-terminal cleavage/methylation domain-containing protein
MNPSRKAFTLVELIVVIVIIGILAAIAAPIMQNMKAKAIVTEAVTHMAVLKEALRDWRMETQSWESFNINFPSDNNPNNRKYPPSINPGDMNGTYFSEECYNGYTNSNGSQLNIECDFSKNTNTDPGKIRDVKSIEDDPSGQIITALEMDQNGHITQYNLDKTGY